MTDVVDKTISVAEAAERIGITTAEAYDLVFTGKLRTVESPTGRRVVPLEALQGHSEQETADERA